MSVLASEVTVAEAARWAKVSEQSVGTWKRQFLEVGKGRPSLREVRPSTREQQLEAEIAGPTRALGEAHLAARVWRKSAEGRLGPSRTSR